MRKLGYDKGGHNQIDVPTYFMIIPGRRSKFAFMISISSLSLFLPLPNVLTKMDSGLLWPMTYDTWKASTKDEENKQQRKNTCI